ncbi:MAG: CYTH domain-containing protein [Candidatus Woesearchaeota archaeon]
MEIEIRAFVEDFSLIQLKLAEIGTTLLANNHIIDLWFCESRYTKFEEVQQDKPGSYALRIRQCDDSKSHKVELNCKVLELEGDHNAFHEYETIVGDLGQTRKILEALGFKVFCTIDKMRKTYKFGNCTINLEDIKGYRPAVELEIIDDKDIENNKLKLHKLMGQLNILEANKIEKSITYLFMKEFSFK